MDLFEFIYCNIYVNTVLPVPEFTTGISCGPGAYKILNMFIECKPEGLSNDTMFLPDGRKNA